MISKRVIKANIKAKKIQPTRAVALGFMIIILIGATLLSLPISSKSGEWTSFLTTLFTATSATCVTGLVLVDTYTHWSNFGQTVILLLIQVGGLGFMTMATLFSLLLRRTITLRERLVMTTSLNITDMSGIVRMTQRVLYGTLLFEGVGAIVLSFRFIPDFGVLEGIRKGVFHSISAFCNAGFDLLGEIEPGTSLAYYVDDPIVNITIMLLVVIGGLGFYVWNDLCENGKFKRLRLHTKIVLLTTGILLVSGAVLVAIFEWNNPDTLGSLPVWARPMSAMFQSVTLRTAGFETFSQGAMTMQSKFLSLVLMLIGGSPGSTAGGIKTVTIAILVITAVSSIKGRSNVVVFGRTLGFRSVMNAITMLMVGVSLIFTGAMVILMTDDLPFIDSLFEATSAFATVGLTTGITSSLGVASQITIILLMFLGRVGVLTLSVAALMNSQEEVNIKYPETQVFVG